MKRIFAIMIAFVMLLSASAYAEKPAFRLENGLNWGMTQEELFALFGKAPAATEHMYEGVDMIQYVIDSDIQDDDCDIWLSMVLVDGGLAMIMYDLLRVDDPAVKQACIADMTSVFGKPIDGGMDRFIASFGMLAGYTDMTAADIGAPGIGCSWELSDGTYMGVYDLSPISFGVYFVNEPRFAAVAEYAAAVPTIESFQLDDGGDLSLESGEVIAPAAPSQMPGFDEFIGLTPALWGSAIDGVIEIASLSNFEFRTSDVPGINSICCERIENSSWSSAEYVFDDGVLIIQRYSYTALDDTADPDPLGALTAIYGEPVSTGPEQLLAILNGCRISPFASANEMLSYGISGDITWYPDDGTFILLMVSGSGFVMYHISSDVVAAVQ